jgi:hypothetical protein
LSSSEPAVTVLRHEQIVVKVRVIGVYAIDFRRLALAQALSWIEAPGPFQQPLADEDRMNARDAAADLM